MIDLQSVVAAQHAGRPSHDEFAGCGDGGELHRGQRGRQKQQRAVDDRARDLRQRRVAIFALQPTDGDFAGELAREQEAGAGLEGLAVGIAHGAGVVDQDVMDAGVGVDLEERLDARYEVVAAAQRPPILVEIAVVVARIGPVGQERSLPNVAVDGAFRRDFEPVEHVGVTSVAPPVRTTGKVSRPAWMFGLPGLSVARSSRPSRSK